MVKSPSRVERPMDFYDALRQVNDHAAQIRRLEWADDAAVIFLGADGKVKVRWTDRVERDLLLTSADMSAEDWVIVRDH